MSTPTAAPRFPIVKPSIYSELRKRVNQYFEEKGKEQTGNINIYTKAVILFSLMGFLYIHLVFFTPVWYFALLECFLMGMTAAGIGFNVMHDGGHGSFSKNPQMNKLAAFTLNMLGGSDYMWNVKHNQIHHSFTNVSGVDDDIDASVFLRLAPQQKHRWFHKIQHFYFWFFYCILYLFWMFFSDYKKYFTNKIGDLSIGQLTAKDHVKFWFSKITHIFFFIVLPVMMVGFTNWLIGFLAMTMSAGLVLSFVFQLAHTVIDADFPETDETNKLPDEFAIHQLKTTANFATKSKWVSWYVGGLNFQIEHHLFPKISHIHYPEISKIVKQVCKEYGIEYLEYKTVVEAIAAHVRFLKEMGSEKTVAIA